jgi:glycosyltransferase involved in cell wall biosynthesis
MNLTLVISSLAAGGAERVITTLANHWAGQGHTVSLLTTHDQGQEPHYKLSESVSLSSVDSHGKGLARQISIVQGLRKKIQNAKPHAVISFLNFTNILTLAACRGLPCPVIVSERLDPRIISIGPAWSQARRLTYRNAACLVAQTPTAAALYEYMAPGRTRVIPNPVPPLTGSRHVPEEWGDVGRPAIISVGRLQHQKGFDIGLRAMKLLPPEYDSWRWVILGEGRLRTELEQLRNELGLRDRVFFAGQVKDPYPWLKHAQIFLMSSRSEGFPNALCEAMATGLPVVSTDCPSGPADIITPDVDGFLVPSEDPAAIATALTKLMGSEDLRAEFATKAPGICQRFSPESVLASWDALVADIIGAS